MRVGRPPAVRARPARVARELALALEIQEEIDREGLTFRDAARRRGCSRMRICRLLGLARLAPDIQAQVVDLTTTTTLEALTVDDLRWVAEAMDWGEQRKRFGCITARQTEITNGHCPVRRRRRRLAAFRLTNPRDMAVHRSLLTAADPRQELIIVEDGIRAADPRYRSAP